MATPFDTVATVDFAPAGKTTSAPITHAQRKALRAMGLEKAELIGKNLQQADDELDTWLGDMTSECAGRAIRKLGAWLDNERRQRGLPLNVRSHRA